MQLSRLCTPRSLNDCVGKRSTLPSIVNVMTPSRKKMPSSRTESLLMGTIFAAVRREQPATRGSSMLRTAKSVLVWLAKIRALASIYS